MTESPSSTEVIFFLGAGASVEAGVPDTYGLVNAVEGGEQCERTTYQDGKHYRGDSLEVEGSYRIGPS
jgi:NAD-dependent SIR2 family protein deacetylase